MKVWICLIEIDYEGYMMPEHVYKNKIDAEKWEKNYKSNYSFPSIEEYELE